MKISILAILICLLFTQPIVAQNNKKQLPDNLSIQKWIRATVNIEVRPYFTDNQAYRDLIKKLINKSITEEKFSKEADKIRLSVKRYTGTAIFCKHNNVYYLITARHVIEDSDNENYSKSKSDASSVKVDKVYDMLFLVANGSGLIRGDSVKNDFPDQIMIMGCNSGPPLTHPFIFSSKEDDLAILRIEYRGWGQGFLKTLLNRGYVPIGLSDIDAVCMLNKGQKITAIGYTGDASVIDRKEQSVIRYSWESDLISLPIVSNGTVADARPSMNTFSGNIFVYHGNSGGPIISNGKLIGVVSNTQTSFMKLATKSLEYYLARDINFTKSSLVIPLLKRLDQRLKKSEVSYAEK